MQKLNLTITSLPGAPVQIPYFRVDGRAGQGPTLTLVAGVHGTEYTGMAAIVRFVNQLDEDQLSGTIIAVPILNQPAFWSRTPFVVPEDNKNLNRSLPGDPGGSYTEVLAHEIFTAFIEPTDYLIDLHAGDLPEALQPFQLFEESPVEAEARRLAAAYGLPYVVRQSRADRTVGGSTSAAAADIGVPAIVAEVGANGLCDERSVSRHIEGIRNVCAELGLLAGEVVQVEQTLCTGWQWMRSPVRGWWQPTVEVGQAVTVGQTLGLVLDPYGVELERITAGVDGWPLFITSSPAVVADGLLLGLAHQ